MEPELGMFFILPSLIKNNSVIEIPVLTSDSPQHLIAKTLPDDCLPGQDQVTLQTALKQLLKTALAPYEIRVL